MYVKIMCRSVRTRTRIFLHLTSTLHNLTNTWLYCVEVDIVAAWPQYVASQWSNHDPKSKQLCGCCSVERPLLGECNGHVHGHTDRHRYNHRPIRLFFSPATLIGHDYGTLLDPFDPFDLYREVTCHHHGENEKENEKVFPPFLLVKGFFLSPSFAGHFPRPKSNLPRRAACLCFLCFLPL